jgi:tetratricopeptide (TPR) repeat protein
VPPRDPSAPHPAAKPIDEPLKLNQWMVYAILCAIAFLAYSNSFGLGFAVDGRSKVLIDARVHAATSENIRLILTKHYWWPWPGDRLYRPLTLASYLFNYAVLGNGENPAGYHVVNLLLHMLNVCLLYELALLVLRKREAALFAAALWAVHPIQTEAVANLAGRADLLSAAAVLGGLLIYIRSIDLAGRRKHLWLAGLFVVAMAGMFSKENAAVLAALMVLWDVAFGWERKPGRKPRQAAYLLMAGALCLLAIVRWKIFEGEPWPEAPFLDNPMRSAGLLGGRLTAVAVIGRYLGLLVWPARLSFDYAYNEIPVVSLSAFGPWLALVAVGGIIATAIARYRADRTLFWAVGFFAIALLPTSNLVFPIGAIMALRFLYLPSAGFAIAAVALVARLNRPKVSRVLLAVAIVALAARTLVRNPAWRDNLALATADVVTAPGSFRTHQLLAQALYESDPKANLDKAIREYEITSRVLEPLPPERSCPQCFTELGTFYYAKAISAGGASTPEARGWFEKAVAALEKARAVSLARANMFDDAQVAHGLPLLQMTGDMKLYLYLARSYSHLGRVDDALRIYREAEGVNPKQREVYDEMATAYATQGKLERAAIVIDEKAFVLGINNATEASLRNLYARIPDGSCALKLERGATALNLDCPRLRFDMCQGWVELDAAYRAARQTPRANSLRASAIQQYGCPEAAFGAGQ